MSVNTAEFRAIVDKAVNQLCDALDALVKDRDAWQKECEANRVTLAETEAALARTMDGVEDLARGQTDVINLLLACRQQGEALPESLRREIDAMMGTAVAVKLDPTALGGRGALIAEPINPDESPFEV